MRYSSCKLEIDNDIRGEDRLKIIGTVKQEVSRLMIEKGVPYNAGNIQVVDKKSADGKRTIHAYYEA